MPQRVEVVRAIRLLLGREPATEEEITSYVEHPSINSVYLSLFDTPECRSNVADNGLALDTVQTSGPGTYRAPLFLLQPPALSSLPVRFEPPTLRDPVWQLCTQAQMEEPEYPAWCAKLAVPPAMHRKYWEFAFIMSVMQRNGLLQPGNRALGFGVGLETMPSCLASYGMQVVATDAPGDAIAGHGWESTAQHSQAAEQLFYPGLIAREQFDALVSFRPVDMNAIPDDLRDFQVCWSSCCFEHLGSIEHGLDFVLNSVMTLAPGGIAVHTTEFNLSSNTDTVEAPGLSIFRKRDIERLMERAMAAGHEVWPLNFHPGFGELDQHIDAPPYAMPHLRLELLQHTCTSIGVIIRRRA